MRIINSKNKGFAGLIDSISNRGESDSSGVEGVVREVLDRVRTGGDKALLEYTALFDGVTLKKSELRVKEAEISRALKSIPKRDVKLLELAAERIEQYHNNQVEKSWFDVSEDGTLLGQKVTPLARVGVYIPGGKASYPSSVLMNVIAARVAGVKEIYMVTPPRNGGIDPYVLAAARIAGVTAVFRAGGAQSIAALAYGTESVPKVDKIVGPGNIYVATAKKLVFGTVDIDMVAGPSEILIISDGTADPDWIAVDMLSQAEHDELASAVLITTTAAEAKRVNARVEARLKRLKRKKIARESIERYGVIIVAKDLKEAATISDSIAPEHLELMVEEPQALLGAVTNAGAIFMGRYTPEAIGDYLAGPSHTLPTGGTARFSSPLGVYDFVKRTSVISFTEEGFKSLGPSCDRFARLEGLEAHALSASVRMKK